MKIFNLITKHFSPVEISHEEAEMAAVSMLTQTQQVHRIVLEDFAVGIAIIMAKVASREYQSLQQIEIHYGVLYGCLTKHCPPLKISDEEDEIAAVSMRKKAQQAHRTELEDFAAEIAIMMAKVANREYRSVKQIERDYSMLYSRTFITKQGA
jgi:anion-transporting  ArsA/GET3 family ATPase